MHVKRISVFLSALLLLGALFLRAGVSEADYNYRVRVSGGLYGTVTAGAEQVFAPGETWYPDSAPLTVTNDRYYFKGYHISGHEELVGSLVVDSDLDLVASYGIKGDTVAYTVRYETADGTTLAPARTNYGNPGDKPVVSYVYVEGYQPQARNLTKTLTANAADNVLRFVYTPIPAAQTETANAPQQQANAPQQQANQTQPTPEPTPTPLPEPPELLELDDEPVPLAAAPNTSAAAQSGTAARLGLIAAILGGTGLAASLAMLIARALRRMSRHG